MRSQATRRRGSDARHHGIQPGLALPGSYVIDVSFGGEGVIVTVVLRAAVERVVAVAEHRPAGGRSTTGVEAVAALGSGVAPVRDRVRAASSSLPGLRVHLEAVSWARRGAITPAALRMSSRGWRSR